MEKSSNINKLRSDVLMRISVFLLYYILMLVFTFILLQLVIGATILVIFNIGIFLNRIGLVLIALLVASWSFVVKIGFGLLRELVDNVKMLNAYISSITRELDYDLLTC